MIVGKSGCLKAVVCFFFFFLFLLFIIKDHVMMYKTLSLSVCLALSVIGNDDSSNEIIAAKGAGVVIGKLDVTKKTLVYYHYYSNCTNEFESP